MRRPASARAGSACTCLALDREQEGCGRYEQLVRELRASGATTIGGERSPNDVVQRQASLKASGPRLGSRSSRVLLGHRAL